MAKYLLLLICFVLRVCSLSSIRMQRDFSYPVVEEFEVYWNVPTFLCHKYGIHFEKYTRQFGIISNPDDMFRGSRMSILYDPGLFPAMMKNSKGRLIERNGGIPQLGNLTEHLDAFRKVVEKVVPEDFKGVGVIDFEVWRPVYRQNWNEQTIYKEMSKDLVRQKHPQWTEKKIETQAAYQFEDASKVFMEDTLKLVKLLRPGGTWGYYAFPYCYNYRNTKDPHCLDIVEKENNRIQWMFDESTALYPSVYMSEKLSEEEHRKFVIGRLNEAWRVASRVSSRRVPIVTPYVWYKYYDSDDFLTQGDMYIALETTRQYKMGGVVIWGATKDVSSKDKCLTLLDYLNNSLGPTVVRVKENNYKSRTATEGFVILPLNPHTDTDIIKNINHTIYPITTARQERSTRATITRRSTPTTTLSPALQNYYNWYKLIRTFV